MEPLNYYQEKMSVPSILLNYKKNRFAIPEIDFLKRVSHDDFWFPEYLTPWYYLNSYYQMDLVLRRRYNQLYALCVNELFSILEKELLVPILTILEKRYRDNPLLSQAIHWFCEEEAKHAEMFLLLNKLTEPRYYTSPYKSGSNEPRYNSNPGLSIPKSNPSSTPYFLAQKASPLSLKWVEWMRTHPDWLSVWLWISVYFEEKTIIYSKAYLKKDQRHLCPVFREVHRLHLLEEIYHVELDEVIIERFYKEKGLINRKVAATLFKSLLKRYSSPMRMSKAIAKVLIQENKENQRKVQNCLAELPSLKYNKEYQDLYLGEKAAPKTWKLMRSYPEFSTILAR